MNWQHARKLTLSLAFVAGTAGFALAQTAMDGSTSPGGSPGATAGQTPSTTGNVSNPAPGPRMAPAPAPRGTTGMGVHDPQHLGNGPSTSHGWAGEAPSTAPENQ